MRTAYFHDGDAWLYCAKLQKAALASAVEAMFPFVGYGMAIGADCQPVLVEDDRPSSEKFVEAVEALEAAHAKVETFEDGICDAVRAEWESATTLRDVFVRARKATATRPASAAAVCAEGGRALLAMAKDRVSRRALRAKPPPSPYWTMPEWVEFRRGATLEVDACGRLVVAWLKEAQLSSFAAGVDPTSDPWPTVAHLVDEWRQALRRAPLDRCLSMPHGNERVRFEWTRDGSPAEMTFPWPGTLGADMAFTVDDPVGAATAVGASDILVEGNVASVVVSRTVVALPLSETGHEAVARLKAIMGYREDGHIHPDAMPGLESTAGLRCLRTNLRDGARYSFRFLSRQGLQGQGGRAVRGRVRTRVAS